MNIPYDPQEETQTLAIASLIVEPYVDSLIGVISEEEFLTQMKNIVKESLEAQIRKGQEEPIGGEEEERLKQFVATLTDTFFTYILPVDSQEKGLQYFRYVFELAETRDIAPKDIFASDELYREVLRNVYTREEYQERITKGSSFLRPETILDVLLKPLLGSLAEDEGETTELYNELKEEMQSNPEVQEQLEAARNTFSKIAGEEMEQIYG